MKYGVQEGAIVVWSLIGYERVIVELYKTFWQRQTRGIFENQKPKYANWKTKRWIFLVQYLVGIGILIILFTV